ncbi:hypothetical protein PInf_012134 [Phytophthora infestans]|nr:hypothetical protein PInf_012056 [Phytophthora infestans]KAI9995090.1 hypothetical protein PInf_012134 [Phytophthora infestans]
MEENVGVKTKRLIGCIGVGRAAAEERISDESFTSTMASPQQIAELSRKIFQRLPQRNIPSGNKVISKQLKGDKVASWFNKPLQLRLGGDDPNFEILNEERLGKLDQMKRRGKSIPKKGAGKRSKK